MKGTKSILRGIGALTVTSVLLTGCPSGNGDKPDTPIDELIDSSKTKDPVEIKTGPDPVKVDGAMFSIPSPIQLGGLIQKSNAPYNADLLNNPKTSDNYVDLVKQSLNLGVYGADLGYCALYDKQQESLSYMRAAQDLSDKLGISDAFDVATIQSVERNLDNKDSLLYIISNSYRRADDYLQTSKRKHIGAFVIVGGWIESLHFAGVLGKESKNPEIVEMIGMQKHTINTILDGLLEKYIMQPGVEEYYNELDDIRMVFEKVNIKYEFVAPETDKENKITTIKSKSTVEMTDEVYQEIITKIEALRTKIVK